MRFTREKIDLAYRKFKSYVYYDNFSLLLRQELAAFESADNFEKRLDDLVIFLNSPVDNNDYFENLLKSIHYDIAPKKFGRPKRNEDLIISNNFTDKNYELEKVNYFFKGDIELYIISILWILEEGYTLHKDYSKDNFAYFLELNSENGRVEDGLRLFKPYFEQYQKWRDTGIDIAKSVLDKDIDVVIISLDIKEYYYNITFDPNLIEKMEGIIRERSNSNSVLLTPMIFEINDRYSKVFPNKDKRKSVLPIGLLSSGILANWYLNDFDNLIKSELSPAYYGRYVDDIQIVLSNTKIPKEVKGKTFNSSLEFFMDKFFVKRKIFNSNIDERKKNEKIPLIYRYTLNNDIEIQKDKIAVYSFESKESRAVLDMFKKKIEQNSSAFWFLPNEDDISNDFDESVYELTYSDTINKLRSVVDIKQSKYGASIFLAKKIKVSLLSDSSKDEKTTEQILTFFKGIVNLEFSSMWEKVLTYFVISNDKEAFWSFLKETLSSIDKIKNSSETKLNGDTINKVKKYLGEYLINCCSLSLALNPNFINVNTWENRCSNYNFKWLEKKFSFPYKSINDYIFSNLLRNSLVVVPLLNYLEIVSKDKVNLVNYNFLRSLDDLSLESLKFNEHKLKYAPRFIYYYEFNINKFLFHLLENNAQNDSYLLEVNGFQDNFKQTIYDEVFDNFYNVNYQLRNNHINNSTYNKETLKHNYFELVDGYRSCNEKLGYNKLLIPNSGQLDPEFKVAVANIKVNSDNIYKSLFSTSNTDKKRRKELIDVLNDAEKIKADVLLLPEVSVPARWLPVIVDESRRKQRMIILGLEHVRINNICYNLLATCLPFEHNGIKDVIVNLRLKNHYSPGETKLILSKGKVIPIPKVSLYNLFVWKGIYFSNYNCYELANIEHRALFKSKVDLLFASEYNNDVNYFSNIVETVSRDVHCYFVQANSSDFGDSRITAPKKTEEKDILRLKGGENNVVLLGKIDVKKLREFQKTRVFGQDTNSFKNTPPDFNHDDIHLT